MKSPAIIRNASPGAAAGGTVCNIQAILSTILRRNESRR
jgi:hypothetical protein